MKKQIHVAGNNPTKMVILMLLYAIVAGLMVFGMFYCYVMWFF
jgi:hypothetical protein